MEKLIPAGQLQDMTVNMEPIGEYYGIKFYNDAVIIFNKLVSSFPSNILAFLKRYKKKDFYSNEKKEMFQECYQRICQMRSRYAEYAYTI